jgi:putative hydrolase of the HAD superfamily
MAYTTRRECCPLGAVETWIFDLDNTLYPASCRLFDQVQVRMTEFICERLSVSPEAAAELRRNYFREHGTTLRGLMTVDNIDPHEFLAFVHDIDLAGVSPDPALAAALKQLDGRKIVHTNGSVRHAERLLDHLGLSDSFCGIIDIVAAEFDPKPALAGYQLLLRRHAVAAPTALMIEDIAATSPPPPSSG